MTVAVAETDKVQHRKAAASEIAEYYKPMRFGLTNSEWSAVITATNASELAKAGQLVITTVKQEYPFGFECETNPTIPFGVNAAEEDFVGICATKIRNGLLYNTQALDQLARGFKLAFGLSGVVQVARLGVVRASGTEGGDGSSSAAASTTAPTTV